MDLTLRQAVLLWEDLLDAHHGRNSYGSDTAEVYAYTLQTRSPAAEAPNVLDEFRDRAARQAGQNLIAVCRMFAERHECDVSIEGEPLKAGETFALDETWGFNHRVKVRVQRREKAS